MAAVIKAINAKIRSNKVTDYLCSTRTYPYSISSPSFPQASRTEIGRRLQRLELDERGKLAQGIDYGNLESHLQLS